MSDDDSRGLETPDGDEPPRATDHASDDHIPTARALTYAGRLEAIDRLAADLLADVRDDDLEGDRAAFVRHVREIRAEVESARLALAAGDVRVVCRRGVGVTSCLGPHPAAFDGDRDAEDGP